MAKSTALVNDFSKSCVLKFLLTEGEKFVIIWFAILDQSAEYSLVTTLIGLVCRFIFAPIEEACFLKFSASKNPALDQLVQWLAGVMGIASCAWVFSILNG